MPIFFLSPADSMGVGRDMGWAFIRQLVASLSSQRLGFEPWPIYVEFIYYSDLFYLLIMAGYFCT
jgi:hypothetical protein